MDAALKQELTPLLEALKGDRNVSKSVRVAAEELLAAPVVDSKLEAAKNLVDNITAAKQPIPRRDTGIGQEHKKDKR